MVLKVGNEYNTQESARTIPWLPCNAIFKLLLPFVFDGCYLQWIYGQDYQLERRLHKMDMPEVIQDRNQE